MNAWRHPALWGLLAALAAGVSPAWAAGAQDGAARSRAASPFVANAVAHPTSSAGRATSPAVQYLLHCGGCHGHDGRGAPERGIPNLRDVVGHFTRTPEGRALIVQVPGVVNTPLDAEQIAQVTNWMLVALGGASLPPGTPPYTADEVRAAQARRPQDVIAVRGAIAARLRALGHDVDAPATNLAADGGAGAARTAVGGVAVDGGRPR